MAKEKKELDDDLLTGGASIVDESGDKKAQKSEKAAAKAKAKAEKNAKKIADKKKKLQENLESVKSQLENETDEKKKEALEAKAKKISSDISNVGKKSKSASKKTIKIVKSVVAIVVVVALLSAYVATGTVRKGLIAYTCLPAQYFTGMTVSDDDGHVAKIKVATYNFYFAQLYNNLQSTQSQYEQNGYDLEQYNMDVDFDKPFSKQTTTNDDDKEVTWLEYLHDEATEQIKTYYSYYLEAVAENDGKEPDITEDQQSELDETLTSYKETANGYGYTLSAYLVKAMGKGVTESVFRQESKVQYIAQNYQSDLSASKTISDYTDEQYNTYKEENKDDLTSVSLYYFECDSEDEAKAFKKALKSDGSNFASLASKYGSSDFYKEYNKDINASTALYATRSTLKNLGLAIATADTDDSTSYKGLDWIFSSKRSAGDIKQYSTSVVYIIEPSKMRDDITTVNVRHILISPITDSSSDTQPVDATTEQWETAYKTAQSVLDEYKSGDKTEDSFSALVADNSSDTGSSSDGGLYENVYPGQMVPTFNSWSFDSSRKAGDTAIIRSQYGYHIMYFVGKTDTPVWQYTAQQSLASDDSETKSQDIEDSYKVKENWFGSRYFEIDTDIDS